MDRYDTIRLAGGLILSIAPVTQLFHTYRRKQADDLSYAWQGMILLGLCMLLAYEYHHNLWIMYIPTTFEAACILILLGLKRIYTKRRRIHQTTPLPLSLPNSDTATQRDLKPT